MNSIVERKQLIEQAAQQLNKPVCTDIRIIGCSRGNCRYNRNIEYLYDASTNPACRVKTKGCCG